MRDAIAGGLFMVLLAVVLTGRACQNTRDLRARRVDLESFSASLRQAYADGDPARAAADPRDRLSKFQVVGPPGEAPRLLVDLNSAGLEELQRLPDIGPVKAGNIVAARTRLGGFKSLEDLLEADGIGEATLAKIAPEASIGGRALAPAPAASAASAAVSAPATESADYPTAIGPSGERVSLFAPEPTPRGEAPVSPPIAAQAPPALPATPSPEAANGAAAPAPPAATPPPGVTYGERAQPVNINTADEAELDRLYGVGPAKARDIIAFRQANGPFLYPSDITKVKGIGESIFLKNRHMIVVK